MNSTILKFLALILMTIDHIGKYIPDMPIVCRWLGRLAAPIFFFCAVEGAVHTHDRKQYLKRLYRMSLLMCGCNLLLPLVLSGYGVQGGSLEHNIFSSILQGVWVIHILEETREQPQERRRRLLRYLVYQLALIVVLVILLLIGADTLVTILGTVLCSVFLTEGSVLLTGVMLLYYWCRDSKKKLAAAFALYAVGYGILTVFQLPQRGFYWLANRGSGWADISDVLRIPFDLLQIETRWMAPTLLESAFLQNYQWMMLFALPLLLCYNGEKGRGWKKLFYIYYPVHIYLLYLVSVFV